MSNFKIMLPSAALVLLSAIAPAAADDLKDKQYVLDLGVAGMIEPRYPGSDEVIVEPMPLFSVGRFFIPGYGEVEEDDNAISKLSIYPSFNFIGSRNSSDSNELKGLKDVDWSLELGLGVAYRYDWIRGFAEVRQGFNGYSGQVANFGIDFIATPTERLQILAGPRLSWGSDDYMETYFGISQKEADNSPVYDKAYKAKAGFDKAGVAATATYALTDRWTLLAQGGWDRLIGDAGDSPIVKAGSENQFYGGAGLTYRFGFDLF